jgi:predicted acetyltransferase
LVDDDTLRPQAAIVDGKIVGATAMLSLKVTTPGLRIVPVGGVTGTGVIATHRRQGLLRGMMQAMFADARERGEAIAGLSASEGSIYGRFGFYPATLRTRWEIERSDARLVDANPGQATCHQLRHTCLTRLREAGMALEAVQAQAGHASIESTRI